MNATLLLHLSFLVICFCVVESCVIGSTAFQNNTNIPVLYTQDGSNISPPLQWKDLPTDAKYVALTTLDPDAASGTTSTHSTYHKQRQSQHNKQLHLKVVPTIKLSTIQQQYNYQQSPIPVPTINYPTIDFDN